MTDSLRPVVCYPCALRFSTIPIAAIMGPTTNANAPAATGAATAPHQQRGNLLPPPPLDEVLSAAHPYHDPSTTSSLIVTNYHPFFDIIYAVIDREGRRPGPDISSVMLPLSFGNRLGNTYLLSEGVRAGGRGGDVPTCVACRGTNQYLDSYYADAVEEAVRTSPYHLDSTHITLFVNVPRALSFSWAAVGALFVKSAVVFGGGRGTVGAHSLCAHLPEEYASFKDMFTPDMRARVVSRLSREVTGTGGRVKVAAGEKRPRDPEGSSSSSPTSKYITRAFDYCHQDESSAVSAAAVAAATAAMISQAEAEGKDAPEAAAAASKAASSVVLSSQTMPDPSTILIELDVRHFLLEMLTGETPLDSLSVVQSCISGKLSNAVNSAEGGPQEDNTIEIAPIAATSHLSHGARNHGDGENRASVLPRDWCTNKGAGCGSSPLPGFVLDDYVVPFLIKHDVSSAWSTHFKGLLAEVSRLQLENDVLPSPGAPLATSARAYFYSSSHLSTSDSLGDALKQTPIRVLAGGDSPSSPSLSCLGAAVMVNIKHSSVLLIGKYTKCLRGMSQSPWFCDGARIGGNNGAEEDGAEGGGGGGAGGTTLLSLQETIANPLLGVFFPEQLPAPHLPSTTVEGDGCTPSDGLPVVAPGGTNAAKDVSVRHAQVLANYWCLSGTTTTNAASGATGSTLAGRILPMIFSSARASLASKEITLKQQSMRTVKEMHNQPRGGTQAAAADPATASFTKYLSTPVRGIDPVLTGMAQVKGFGHYKFHTAGREDVDVRMLGTGRPFVLEVLSPERSLFTGNELRAMEEIVNSAVDGDSVVNIHGLAYTNAAVTVALAKHSSEKKKTYRCVVWSSRRLPIDPRSPADAPAYVDPLIHAVQLRSDIVVKQSTPLRVLHRRSLLAREKVIHSVKISAVNEHWMIVDLETQAGTYVKEFIHGDCGRTIPNLGSLLGTRTDIIQLDVLGMSHLATEC